MEICDVTQENKKNVKVFPEFHNIPINTKHGWVPYFVFYDTAIGAEFRIAKIPPEWYKNYEYIIWSERHKKQQEHLKKEQARQRLLDQLQ